VTLDVNGKTYDFLKDYEEELDDIFIVSQVVLRKSSDASFRIKVAPAEGEKCERCWHYRTDVGKDSVFPTVCARCAKVLRELQ
jgi:isoleucyl-tRNA synthetase